MTQHSRTRSVQGPWAFVFAAALTATGCTIFEGMFGGGNDARLREPTDREVALIDGQTEYRCSIRYEGGPNESWAFDRRRCPPKYGDKPHSEDDRPAPDRVPPTAGAKAVVAAVPGWCERYAGWGLGRNWSGGLAVTDALQRAESVRDLLSSAQFIAVASCDRKHYRPRQEWVASWVQILLNRTGMTLDDAHRLFGELVEKEEALAEIAEHACTGTPLISALLCADDERRKLPTYVDLDALELAGKLTDRERIAYLVGCSGSHCGIDADAVRWSEARGLVEQDTKRAAIRFAALVRLGALRRRLAQAPATPATVKDAYAGWRKNVPADDLPLVRAALGVIVQGQAGDAPACPAELVPALEKRLTAIRPATVAGLEAVLEQPVTQILWRALSLCDRSRATLAALRAGPLSRTKASWLGPRRAAIAAGGYGATPLPQPKAWVANEVGVVAKIDAPKDGVSIVHLEGRQWFEPIERCRETRRIDAIRSDGSISYREVCKIVGRSKHRTAPDPLVVDTEVARELAPGRTIRVWTDRPRAMREWVDGKVVSGTGATRAATIETIFADAQAAERGTGVRYWLGFDLD